jgi:hypothetical protein
MIFGISLLTMIGITTRISYAQDFQITATQLKQTNILFNELQSLEEQDSVNTLIIANLDSLTKVYEQQAIVQDSLANNQQLIIKDYQTNYNNLQEQYNKVEKQKKVATGFATGGGILSVCLLLVLILL